MDQVEYGHRPTVLTNEILRTTVGSTVHGIAIEGTDDHDEMGVYIAPPAVTMGIVDQRDSYVWRTQPEGVRSGHGDVDLVVYELRKFLRLAAKGNPTVLVPLFVPDTDVLISTPIGESLRDIRDYFLSQHAIHRFLGYMHGQHERMMGKGRQSKVPNRPELIERYGWDVKYGSHALRLSYQAREIVMHGRLTLPMREDERQRVLSVKRGEVARYEVSQEITENERFIKGVLDEGRSPLPEKAKVSAVSNWAVRAQWEHWGVR